MMRARWKNLPDQFANGWKYQIVNAAALGAQDLGNGYYRFIMGPDQDRRFVLQMSGGTMPNPPQQYTLDPRAGGAILNPTDSAPALTLPVKEGQMVTVIAQGRIRVMPDSTFNGPNGRGDAEYKNRQFLLSKNVYEPHQYIGAIVGSFDRFSTAFVVGADKSIVVPPGATNLALAVNDMVRGYGDNRDGAFTLYVFISDPPSLPTQYLMPGSPALGQPVVAEPAANMPELDIDVFQALPLQPDSGQKPPSPDARLLLPYSYVAYAVYHSDGKDGEVNPPGPGCGSKTPLGTALLLSTSALGMILVRRPRGKRRR